MREKIHKPRYTRKLNTESVFSKDSGCCNQYRIDDNRFTDSYRNVIEEVKNCEHAKSAGVFVRFRLLNLG